MELRFENKWSASKTQPLKYFAILPNAYLLNCLGFNCGQTCERVESQAKCSKCYSLGFFVFLFFLLFWILMLIVVWHFTALTQITPQNPHVLNISNIYCRRMASIYALQEITKKEKTKNKRARVWINLVIGTSLNQGEKSGNNVFNQRQGSSSYRP